MTKIKIVSALPPRAGRGGTTKWLPYFEAAKRRRGKFVATDAGRSGYSHLFKTAKQYGCSVTMRQGVIYIFAAAPARRRARSK